MSNAGILTPGPLEVLPVAAVRHEFEVNVFAGLAVINAFLPALRRARGRIARIAAMTGRLPLPLKGRRARPRRPWRLSPTSTRPNSGLGRLRAPAWLMRPGALSGVSAAGRR